MKLGLLKRNKSINSVKHMLGKHLSHKHQAVGKAIKSD